MSQESHISEIRELAKRYSVDALEQCIQQALHGEQNSCYNTAELDEIMNVLAKAEYVKSLVDKGMTLPEAIRELGKRMRALQTWDSSE